MFGIISISDSFVPIFFGKGYDKVINLIKCGAFNALEGKSTEEVLKEYIGMVCDMKKNLTMQNANMLIDLYLLPQDLAYNMDVYKLTKELRRHRDSNKLWYCADRLDIPMNKLDSWRQIFKDRVLGPDKPSIGRVKMLHIRKIVLKLEPSLSIQKTRQCIHETMNALLSDPYKKSVLIYFDVDPL